MMDILKRIDHAQQFCKFYADGSYSVETEKWKHHVTPKFIEDIRQYIESLQLKLMHLQTQQAEPMKAADEFDLRQLLAEERYKVRQLSRALREQVESPTFLGEPLITHPAQPEQQAEPVAWAGYDLDGMVEAFSRVIEAHHSSKHPFHNPIDMSAKMALRILRGFIPAMKAYATSPKQQAEPVQERITHITWDERGVRTVNGIPDDAPRCKELSASEILNMMPSAIPAEYDGPLMEFARAVEAKLKERNGY